MKYKKYIQCFILLTVCLHLCPAIKAAKSAGRETLPVTDGWNLWHDSSATWENDTLYLPEEVDIAALAINAPEPTGGWKTLDKRPSGAITVNLPAVVEEYFTPDGKIKTALPGVYWFWQDVNIPADWKGKTVRLKIESARLRVEVFANAKLVGYDIVGDVPYSCYLTNALSYGKRNRIAVRVTNPGGNQRGWEDYYPVKWGNFSLPASRDFGGINGTVELVATNNTCIDDIFVKNLRTADYRTIEVQTTINNRLPEAVHSRIKYEILPVSGGAAIYADTEDISIPAEKSQFTVQKRISCPEASLWNIETPELYVCRVTIAGNTSSRASIDSDSRKFGFRVFEVKIAESDDQSHYFLNGKRFIFKGGIDFSYYAFTGSYPTEEMAVKSIQAARSIGQNAFNFHRRIGYPIVLEKADEMGLFLYEEPGGFHIGGQGYDVSENTFSDALMHEKTRRMVLRDRNHPSLIMYSLCNEDNYWNDSRQKAMEEINCLDESRLIFNSSGGNGGGYALSIQHIRPYEKNIRMDFTDNHTVGSGVFFDENDFNNHIPLDGNTNILYWGEVKCYVGPENWYEIAKMFNDIKKTKGSAYKGYNYSYYLDFGRKIAEFFTKHAMAGSGSGAIQTPGDLSKEAGNGKMYGDGRNAQTIMSYDRADGYAINAWSGGNGWEGISGWYSGIVDDGRNVKGDPAIYAYYTRPLQIVIQRKTPTRIGGKTFPVTGRKKPTPAFQIKLINQGILEAGDYTLVLKLKDGAGKYDESYRKEFPIHVEGGNVFAQNILTNYGIELNESLHGGFVTLEGELYDSKQEKVADGAEQILVTNRPSFKERFNGLKGEVHDWPAAKQALEEANAVVTDFDTVGESHYIAASGAPDDMTLNAMLSKVENQGTTLLVKMDTVWAEKLQAKGILSAAITEWGAKQKGYWNGNGFGYIDYFVGYTGMPERQTVSTTGWEVPGDPNGFYPFESKYPTHVYGTFVARPNHLRVLIGTIDYGKGKIILAPTYPVDDNHPFNDLLFYNMISMKIK
ncbi:MAG: hypothetical protein LBN71_04425 [Tannerella sp.]|jgi:hypothetical protein|nr:hypothetical protein [Tannerella sp.]